MSGLNDIDHVFGGDPALGGSGDLATVQGLARGQQRILRRLLTNPGDYLWQPDYGGGLRQFVGSVNSPAQIVALIRSQLALEAGVSRPLVTLKSLPAGLAVTINYTDSASNQPAILNFEVSA